MSGSEALDRIWQSYQVDLDCLKIAKRSIDQSHIAFLKNTNFLGSTAQEARALIDASRANADNYVILSMWAVFERKLFDYLRRESGAAFSARPSPVNARMRTKIEDDIEFWRIDEVLDIFKTVVSSDLIGQAKQVKKYRDWIAHRNPRKPPPANVVPVIAYRLLSEILNELDR